MEARNGAEWRDLAVVEALLCRQAAPACFEAAKAGLLPPLPAFHALLLPMRRVHQLQVAEAHSATLWRLHQLHARTIASPLMAPRHVLLPPLRVVILRGSSNANVARIASLLSLSRRFFAPSLYTTGLDVAAVAELRSRLGAGHVDHTSIASNTGAAEVAQRLSHRSRCALVVDCSGHTAGNLLRALVHRPCKVASAALGFAGSYGGDLVDYLTVDRLTVGPEHPGSSYSQGEKLAMLPHTYQVSPVAHGPPTAAGGRGSVVLIGTFTRAIRWHPVSFGQWMGALIPPCRARLYLLADDQLVRERIRREAAAAGVPTRRMMFGRFIANKEAHISRHRALSLYLDSTPLYGAHTTAADAIWEGVPVLSLPADSWASRVGLSVASASGAPQPISRSLREQQVLMQALLLSFPHGSGWQYSASTGVADGSTNGMLRTPPVAVAPLATFAKALSLMANAVD